MLKRNGRRILKLSIILFICGFVFHFSFVTFKYIENNRIKTEEKYSGLPKDLNQQKADEKVDWHNYNQIELESKRKGPGEQGAAFYVPPGKEKRKKELYRINGFNALASDFIAIDRSLPDVRHKDCKKKKYLRNLPSVSVVVPFHNEHLSTLMRTTTSVLNRAPPHLIKEVILVDDFSSKEELKGELEKYIRDHLPKVRVIRINKREGLIRAKLIGAKAAVGDVLIFIDSHTEANVNWLPPLLDPIAKDQKTVVCPFIDVIEYDTFAYRAFDEGARGSFDWGLSYKRLPLLSEDLAHPAEPFKSPVMLGGLFAIDRSFFWKLGGYDEGLDIWGGEQYDLSFKVWQCGGQIFDAPCSRFGHLYRKFSPYRNPSIDDFAAKNYKRVVEVWMDEYKEYFYLRRPHYRNLDSGDLSQQKALRERLKCKPFKWFMEEINFDQPKKYPPIEPPNVASGEIRNVASNLCIDTRFRHQNEMFGLEKCIKDHGSHGREQQFILTWRGDIRPNNRTVCFDVHSSDNHAPVVLMRCHGMQGNQEWEYNYKDMQLHHRATHRCLDCDAERKVIFMNPCDTSLKTQRWKFEVVNKTAIDNL